MIKKAFLIKTTVCLMAIILHSNSYAFFSKVRNAMKTASGSIKYAGSKVISKMSGSKSKELSKEEVTNIWKDSIKNETHLKDLLTSLTKITAKPATFINERVFHENIKKEGIAIVTSPLANMTHCASHLLLGETFLQKGLNNIRLKHNTENGKVELRALKNIQMGVGIKNYIHISYINTVTNILNLLETLDIIKIDNLINKGLFLKNLKEFDDNSDQDVKEKIESIEDEADDSEALEKELDQKKTLAANTITLLMSSNTVHDQNIEVFYELIDDYISFIDDWFTSEKKTKKRREIIVDFQNKIQELTQKIIENYKEHQEDLRKLLDEHKNYTKPIRKLFEDALKDSNRMLKLLENGVSNFDNYNILDEDDDENDDENISSKSNKKIFSKGKQNQLAINYSNNEQKSLKQLQTLKTSLNKKLKAIEIIEDENYISKNYINRKFGDYFLEIIESLEELINKEDLTISSQEISEIKSIVNTLYQRIKNVTFIEFDDEDIEDKIKSNNPYKKQETIFQQKLDELQTIIDEFNDEDDDASDLDEDEEEEEEENDLINDLIETTEIITKTSDANVKSITNIIENLNDKKIQIKNDDIEFTKSQKTTIIQKINELMNILKKLPSKAKNKAKILPEKVKNTAIQFKKFLRKII